MSVASLPMTPVDRPVCGEVRPPGSKSITNRALVCAALAEGTSTLLGALDSEDTQVMIDSLRRLGIRVESAEEGQTLTVAGCGGRIPAATAELFVGNSGTTLRFLTAVCALGLGRYVLDGVPRMRQRPVGDLLEALQQLGVRCGGADDDRFPPVWVAGGGLPGGTSTVRGDISSQFLSGLLLAAPLAHSPVTLRVQGALVSRPYVTMTLRIMEAFGAVVQPSEDGQSFVVPAPQGYRAREYRIEPDASAASYFWAAAAITGGEVTVRGLSRQSLQGDVGFVDCLRQMGCQVLATEDSLTVRGRAVRGVDVDMNAISDTVPTLAVVALFARGPSTIRGVAHIRHKETDRIGDLARELRKFGAEVEERADGLRIVPPPSSLAFAPPEPIETYRDHRMAMSFALAGLVRPGVVILDPLCTAKTYPAYFRDLARLCKQE